MSITISFDNDEVTLLQNAIINYIDKEKVSMEALEESKEIYTFKDKVLDNHKSNIKIAHNLLKKIPIVEIQGVRVHIQKMEDE